MNDNVKIVVPPLSVIYLYITGSCNLNCRHCWIDPVFEKDGISPDKYLPWADIKKIAEDARELGLGLIKITGGEPFLHPEMCDILYRLKEMGLSLSMETNGTLIGEREAVALKDNAVRFSVSIDGPTAEMHDSLRGVKGAFDRTMTGLKHVRREKLDFQIISCLYRGNSDRLAEMVEFARQVGASSLKINVINSIARSDQMNKAGELLTVPEVLSVYRDFKQELVDLENFRVIFDIPPAFKSLKEIRTHGFGTCGILYILGVLHNGHAGLCGIGLHVKELDFGDLKTLGIKQIWEENAILNSIRENLPSNLEGICGRCALRSYCLGKCIANTYNIKQNLFGAYGFCQDAYSMGLFPETRIVN
jgi:SynChlorMet cassette radical SAM/SPASM protein ScmF